MRIRCEITKFLLIFIALISFSCTSRRRFHNYTWQLDSLHYYTVQIDSLFKTQEKLIAELKVDIYTKSNELSEKIEMLNTRIGDTESELSQISEKISSTSKYTTSTESLPTGATPETRLIYESAYLNYVKGNYAAAIDGFKSYLKSSPNSPLSDNALYWIGESYAAMGKTQSAVNTFEVLINKYPQSTKKPTALYKLGIIYEEVNDKKSAYSYYKKILADYPNSPEASLVRSKLGTK